MAQEVRVGYYFSKRKAEKMNFKSFLEYLSSVPGVSLKFVDPLKSLEDQCTDQIDLFLFKVTDELVAAQEKGDEGAARLISKLEKYLEEHPEIVQVDPIENQRKVLNRTVTSQLLETIESQIPSEMNVRMPRHVTITERASKYELPGFQFPVICKTTLACGTPASHRMGIAFCEEHIHSFEPPILVQEFYNHNSALFKVFVVGDQFHAQQRASLPNIPSQMREPIFFDSQLPFAPQLERFSQVSEASKNPVEVIPPSNATLKVIAKALEDALNLSLFGYDVIVEKDHGYVAVVDVNYFPTFKGFPDFHPILLQFLRSKIQKLN